MRHLLTLDFWLDVLAGFRDAWAATALWYTSGHYDEPMPEVCPWCGQDVEDEPVAIVFPKDPEPIKVGIDPGASGGMEETGDYPPRRLQ